MKTEMLDKIILLSEDERLNGKIYNDKFDHYFDFFYETNDSYDECSKIKRGLLLVKNSTMILDLLVENINIKRLRKKILSGLFDIPKDKITGDFSSFLKKESHYEVFVDDFQYSALVPNDKLSSLNIIWGDANLQKLHDFEKLTNLKVVIGDVYTSDAINTNGLNNLEVVTGDLHIEKLDCINDLKNLIYVGGKIYTKNGIVDHHAKKKVKSK